MQIFQESNPLQIEGIPVSVQIGGTSSNIIPVIFLGSEMEKEIKRILGGVGSALKLEISIKRWT